jgi:hypothetical protein
MKKVSTLRFEVLFNKLMDLLFLAKFKLTIDYRHQILTFSTLEKGAQPFTSE